jgi:deoxyadenosine/deoxycytidine kinase
MVFAKMLFETGYIEDVNYQIYLRWFDCFVEECPLARVVYVKTDPSLCYERIAKRSRIGESSIPLTYLQDCHRYHEEMLNQLSLNCVCQEQLMINGNVDIYETASALTEMIHQVEAFILE